MVLALGLGMRPPWRLVGQRLDTGKQPHELHLDVSAERGSLFACPACGKACKAHDFAEVTWRHLNFAKKGCKVLLQPTPEAIQVFNRSHAKKNWGFFTSTAESVRSMAARTRRCCAGRSTQNRRRAHDR